MKKPLSVRQFNEYVKSNLKHDPIFQRVYLSGELANIKANNYHLYFSLKEGSELIDCVIYYYEDKNIDFSFQTGQEVIIRGNLSYNNYSSRLIIVTNEIVEVGISSKYQMFLKMKDEFKKKGYFDIENKKTITKMAKKIGLITSKEGAAIVDFLAMINQVPNDIHVFLFPVKVQGDRSKQMVSNAVRRLDILDLDAIVITRGGGSNEDLSSFNDREVIEAVFEANTPIITAIGHNIDQTLVDLVSDLCLQTPTEAGSFIISGYRDYYKKLEDKFNFTKKELLDRIYINKLKLEVLKSKIKDRNPMDLIEQRLEKLNSINKSLDKAIASNISYNLNRLKILYSRINSANKFIELSKEKIVILNKGQKVFSKHSIKKNDTLSLLFSDGEVKVRVIDG